METRWLYRTSGDFAELREASKNVCVIPVGSIEKHGLHMPLGSDVFQPSAVAYQASQIETVTVFPDFVFGDVPGAQPEGGMTFDTGLMIRFLEEICDQIGKCGFTKILLLNGHGGNGAWLHSFQRTMENKVKPYAVIRAHVNYPAPYGVAKTIELEGPEAFPELTKEDCDYLLRFRKEGLKTGHACMSEVSLMMGIAPETIHLDRLGVESGASQDRAGYLNEAGLSLVDDGWWIDFPNFFSGDDPVGCTERIGKLTMRLEVERFAKSLKVLKDDENILKWHNERIAKLK